MASGRLKKSGTAKLGTAICRSVNLNCDILRNAGLQNADLQSAIVHRAEPRQASEIRERRTSHLGQHQFCFTSWEGTDMTHRYQRPGRSTLHCLAPRLDSAIWRTRTASPLTANLFAGFFSAVVLLAAALLGPAVAQASDWSGGDAPWSSDAIPGWNGTGVPNAIGASALNTDFVNSITTQDVVGGVTVGTLSLGGANDISWSHVLTNQITLNQDGAGAGTATISNTNTSTGATNALIVGSAVTQTITLADDLLISNTGGSTAVNGAIQIIPKMTGAGNITFHSDAPIGAPTITSFPGAIRLQNGTTASTFAGSVLVEKGLVAYNGAASFGAATNVITLGAAGQGDAWMMPTASVSISQPVTVAAGSGGTLTVGSPSDSSFTPFAAASSITLNGNVTLRAGTLSLTATQTYSAPISGVGGITKTGSAVASLNGTN